MDPEFWVAVAAVLLSAVALVRGELQQRRRVSQDAQYRAVEKVVEALRPVHILLEAKPLQKATTYTQSSARPHPACRFVHRLTAFRRAALRAGTLFTAPRCWVDAVGNSYSPSGTSTSLISGIKPEAPAR
jgi:hypothetical protein